MEEEVKGLGDYLEVLVRRKYWVIISALILIAITVGVAQWLPATYKSEGLILIESQEIPSDLIQSTVTSYADQRIEVIRQRLITTAKVTSIVKKHNLYVELRQKYPISTIVELFKENITVEMIQANVVDPRSGRAKRASIAFKVSFSDKSAQTAQIIANELVTEFLKENVRTRTNRATETMAFLKEEANKFQTKIQKLEKQIADFKDEYSDSLPELLEYNLSTIERLETELTANQNQVLVLKDQITTMSLQLANIPAYLEQDVSNVQNFNNTSQMSSSEQQLLQLKSEYSRLLGKYAENHPDIISLQRQINNLEKEVGVSSSEQSDIEAEIELAKTALKAIEQRYSSEHPDVKASKNKLTMLESRLSQVIASATKDDIQQSPITTTNTKGKRVVNPIYLQIKSQVDSSQREIIRLRNREVEIKERLTDFEQRVYKTHQVQRAYDDLTRDYDNNLAQYQQLRAKQLKAELGENLESENKGESFTLIEPPQLALEPEKPNRPKIMAMGVIGSIGAGIALGLFIEMLFGGVRGYSEISRVIGRTPLVVVPMITTEKELKKKESAKNKWLLLFVIACITAIVAFHFYVMDLEVLWFKVMRTIGSV